MFAPTVQLNSAIAIYMAFLYQKHFQANLHFQKDLKSSYSASNIFPFNNLPF
jgi:hypothetical protein